MFIDSIGHGLMIRGMLHPAPQVYAKVHRGHCKLQKGIHPISTLHCTGITNRKRN